VRRPIVAVVVVELTVVASCLISPTAVEAQNGDPLERLRFSLVHEAVPRYYEMVGIVDARDEGSAGRSLLPDIDPPEALTIETVDPQSLWAQALSSEAEPRKKSTKKPATYSLSETWTAQLSYQHAVLAKTLSAEELRTKKLTDFSTDRDRDVLGLQMDWRMAASSKVGLGYRFQSSRGAPGSGISGIGDSFMHAFTLGFTREWGGAPPEP
jgi:hypothetical protein